MKIGEFINLAIDETIAKRGVAPVDIGMAAAIYYRFCYENGLPINAPQFLYRGVNIRELQGFISDHIRITHKILDTQDISFTPYETLPAGNAYIHITPAPSVGGMSTSGNWATYNPQGIVVTPSNLFPLGPIRWTIHEEGFLDSESKPKECQHKWKKYVGLIQVFDFCETCDTKRSCH